MKCRIVSQCQPARVMSCMPWGAPARIAGLATVRRELSGSLMTMSNRDRVGRGLEILASGLGPFVDARMRATVPSGSDWVGVLADRDRSRHRTVRRYSLSDPRFLLRVVTEQC